MVSGKGILYTVLGAAGAAVLAGTVLTGGTRSEKFRKFGSGVQNLIGFIKGKSGAMMQSGPSDQRAEFDQANQSNNA